MKRITIAFCTAVFLFSCGENKTAEEPKKDETTSSTSTSDDKAKTEEWVPVDTSKSMEMMMKAGTPGPEHAMLAKSNGVWDAEMSWWKTANSKPELMKASCTNKMVFDGRYQESTFKGDMMGMPFEGVSTTGYDNTSKKYFSTWMDNMSTGMMKSEGDWDDATKSLTFKSKSMCPGFPKEVEMKEVFRIIDDNTHVMEMYGPDPLTGKEFKNMEIKLTRKK